MAFNTLTQPAITGSKLTIKTSERRQLLILSRWIQAAYTSSALRVKILKLVKHFISKLKNFLPTCFTIVLLSVQFAIHFCKGRLCYISLIIKATTKISGQDSNHWMYSNNWTVSLTLSLHVTRSANNNKEYLRIAIFQKP